MAQELLAAEKAKLTKAAAKRQKKAQKKSRVNQKQKKQLHLAAEAPQEDSRDTDLAAEEASYSGAGPSTSSNALATAQEVCSLARVHCVDWSTVMNVDAEMGKGEVSARVARRPSILSLSGTWTVSRLGDSCAPAILSPGSLTLPVCIIQTYRLF